MSDKADDPRARNSRLDEPAGPLDATVGWGSDVAAQMLRRLEIPYIALNPGASYRGLHDSLVNHLGNRTPEMLVCLHEEHAVAIAQGYAKVTGRPIAVALHSNVGLMHATMAIFDAWCDRQPMLILGATGPVDAALRRPWIDWIHTSQDQGALVRNFVKWDDQPGSIAALPESILRAWQQSATAPNGPVYVCLDAAIQEQPVTEPIEFPDPNRYRPAPPSRPDAVAVAEAARLLAAAERPLTLYGRCRRTEADWGRRVALAERLGAAMLSDLKAGSMVPTDHPLHAAPPFNQLSGQAKAALGAADLILSVGWIDLGGVLGRVFDRAQAPVPIIHAGHDLHLHGGWGKEHLGLAPIDVHLLGDPDAAVADLLAALPDRPGEVPAATMGQPAPDVDEAGDGINLRHVAGALAAAVGAAPVTFSALARAWPVALWPHRDPLAYLGKDGGGGVGSGPGITIGAALALKGSGRLPDEHQCAVDGRALPDPGAFYRRQQPLLLQRRAPPGERRAAPQPQPGEPLDRSAHRRSRARHRDPGPGPGRRGHRPGHPRRGPPGRPRPRRRLRHQGPAVPRRRPHRSRARPQAERVDGRAADGQGIVEAGLIDMAAWWPPSGPGREALRPGRRR